MMLDNLRKHRVAIVHDWLTVPGGAEKVLGQFINIWPDADIYTLFDHMDEQHRAFLKNCKVHTSFLQRMPFSKNNHRLFLPLMPLAVEQFDLSEYDLIISSSYAVAKGVITSPNQLHISYVHSPIRYAWDLQHQYLKESRLDKGIKSIFARFLLHYIRLWDYRTASGPDFMLANSKFIAKRIKKTYGRVATVVYPPVDLQNFRFKADKGDFYLTASRLVPYKMVHLIVEAFGEMPDKKLIVIGDGPERERLQTNAKSNITFLGQQPHEILEEHMRNAKAFIFAAEEDFGITPVEAQSCGTPVIAFGRGGALETVVPVGEENATGVFFYNQSSEDIIKAVGNFEALKSVISPFNCNENSKKFSTERFRSEIVNLAEQLHSSFK